MVKDVLTGGSNEGLAFITPCNIWTQTKL